jgi:hypothetical protein
MKPYRGRLLATAILATSLSLFGCGNALEGGSTPSGSNITAEAAQTSLEPDLFLTVCSTSIDPVTGIVTNTYESGLTNTYGTATLHNNSTPNTPTGSSTNHDVTMNRYRVDFTGINKTVSIPSIDGPSQSVIVPKDGTATMTVLVMDFATMEYIRSHYSTIGNGESLTLRASVTIWGEDVFQATVETTVDFTLVVDEYDRC